MREVSNSFSVEYNYLADENVVVATVSGRFDLADAETIEHIKTSIAKLNEYDCSKYLVDHRMSEFICGTFIAYDRPGLLESLGLKHWVKMAGVSNKITKQIHFLETVVRNRGWMLRVFTDYDEALAWLTRG